MAVAAALVGPVAGASETCGGAAAARSDWCGCPMDIFGKVYVAIGHVLDGGYLLDMHVYVESNGVDGLQRGGFNLFGDIDHCTDGSGPYDTYVL